MKYLILPETIIKIQKIWAALRYMTITWSQKIWKCPVLIKQDFQIWTHSASREQELCLEPVKTSEWQGNGQAEPPMPQTR